jgi:alanyl-tRNA synthetase
LEDRLYYKDPYLNTFTARLVTQEKDPNGRWYAVLDQTAFYPTGGGQPFDTGTLNDKNVLETEEIDGRVRHYLEEPLEDSSKTVEGKINWDRRFDHMQQHAGQHILTAVFEDQFGISTAAFHLGEEVVSIDLDCHELTEQQVLEAEEFANKVILENRLIETIWPEKSELPKYRLRKAPAVDENIRLVIIQELDYNPCGGTHPRSTSEVGSIKILDWERQKKKIRVYFVCGKRVLTQLHEKQKVLKDLVGLFNAPEHGLGAAARRVINQGKELEKSLDELRELHSRFQAKELADQAAEFCSVKFIGHVYQDHSIQELQKLARAVAENTAESVVLLINESHEKLQFVSAKGSAPSISMKQLCQSILPLINGKGGGSDVFAQGGGEPVLTGNDFLQRAQEIIKKELGKSQICS